jgi:GNAT superfamily N-acetyltransferase
MIEIRVADVGDVDRVVDLFEAYRDFYQQAPDRAGALAFLEQRLLEESATMLLAIEKSEEEMEGEQIVGFAQLYHTFSSLSLKPLWILGDLYVKPEVRRHGVGRLLLERARGLAVETHAEGLMLQTAQDNYRAQSLYEALGWEQEKVFLIYNLLL